jgi:ABC-type transport system involved in cytochrome c biogenesis permease component
LGGLIFVLALQAVTLVLMVLWFALPGEALPAVAGLAALGDVGLVSAGTLLASMAFRTRAREAVLPALLLPVAFPWLLCGVRATTGVLEGDTWADLQTWVAVMAVFDVVFLTAGWLLFESAVED